jgi:D-methionine transport system ATP-binding protein
LASVRIEGVEKRFVRRDIGVQALQGVDLEIDSGEFVCLLGPSGCGKTTLLNMIAGLEAPDRGRILVGGREVRGPSRDRAGVFQDGGLFPWLSCRRHVEFGLKFDRLRRKERERRAQRALERVGLGWSADRFPHELSGGQKQRVAIARALANRPKVLLSDEATSALDPETTKSILGLLRQINQEFGLTILLITHELSVVKEVCDRVAVLDGGRLVEEGPVVDVFARPQAALTGRFVRGLFGAELPPGFPEDSTREGGALVRLSFVGQSASDPIISSMVRQFAIDANIVTGHLDHVGGTPFGQLVVELTGERGRIAAGLEYLRQCGVEIEEGGRRAG